VLPPLGKGFILKSSVSRASSYERKEKKKGMKERKEKNFHRPYKIDLLLPPQNIHD